jgi:hypothetical protein
MKQMDEAAEKALAKIEKYLEAWAARDLVKWWAGWYLKAGHKRLGRILVGLSKNADF